MCCVATGIGADMWVANGTDASLSWHTQYPPSLTHCALSMTTTNRQILKPDAITQSLGHHTLRELKTG